MMNFRPPLFGGTFSIVHPDRPAQSINYRIHDVFGGEQKPQECSPYAKKNHNQL